MRRSILLLLFLLLSTLLPAAHDVVLITLDTTRADHLELYGYGEETVPNITAFAGGATLYTQAWSVAPLTLPAHLSIMTGLLPEEHGVLINGYSVKPGFSLLSRTLQKKGYTTAAFISASVLAGTTGMSRGFALYDDKMTQVTKGSFPTERFASETVEKTLEYLARTSSPRFLWVHLYDPHAPYNPPRPYASRFSLPYDGEIATMDAALGRLLTALPSDALVVIVGDHGEMLGEHGEDEHGILIYRSALHVPLIIRRPGQTKGTVDTTPISITAIHDIILDFAAGRPWKHRKRPITFSSYYGELVYGFKPLRGILDYPHMLIWEGRRTVRLYDLKKDPAQLHPIREKVLTPVLLRRLKDAIPAITPPKKTLSAETKRSLEALGYLAPMGKRSGKLIPPEEGLKVRPLLKEAHTALTSGRVEQAEALARKILERNPRYSDALFILARIALAQGKFKGALRWAGRITADQPFRAGGFVLLGKAEEGMGRWKKAEEAYRLALKLDPSDPSAVGGVGRILLHETKWDDLAALLETSLARHIVPPGLWKALADHYREQKKFGKAFHAYHRAWVAQPGDTALLIVLAESAETAGHPGQSYIYYRQVLRRYPNDPRILYRTARTGLSLKKDLRENHRRLQRALNLARDPALIRKIRTLLNPSGE